MWDIDEPAAEIVREIFQMCVNGMGPTYIAKTLRERTLDVPEVYRRKKNGLALPEYKRPNHYWTSSAVAAILDRREYIGTAVTNRASIKSYKDRTVIRKPPEEWTIFEDAHPEIIDKDTFDTVQRIRSGRKRMTKLGDMGALNGKLYCEDCGAKLHIKRRAGGEKSMYIYYICRNSRAHGDVNTCTPHSVRKEIIEHLVLADIKRVITLARDSENKFVEMVSKQSRQEIEKSVKRAKMEYAKAENRIRQLDEIITHIYEDKVSGDLSAERFSKMLVKYEQEQNTLTARMNELQPLIDEAAEQALNTDRFLQIVKTHTEIETLTAEVVNEFIERIVVGETVITQPRKFSHWKDEKQQSIKIIYIYIGVIPETGEAVTAETREKIITTT